MGPKLEVDFRYTKFFWPLTGPQAKSGGRATRAPKPWVGPLTLGKNVPWWRMTWRDQIHHSTAEIKSIAWGSNQMFSV